MSGFWFGKKISLLGGALAGSGAEFRHMELEDLELGHEACRLDNCVYYLLVRKGAPVCQVNQDRIRLEAGEGLFINKENAWRLTGGSKGGNILDVIRIGRDYLEAGYECAFTGRYINPVTRSEEFPYLKLEKDQESHRELLGALESAVRAAAGEEPCYEMEVKGYLCLAWGRLCREFLRLSPSLKKAAHREKDRLKEILRYLHEHYREKITLKELSAHCGISPGECCRFFKRHMGQSPFEYLQVYRILQSMPELLERTGSIGEIALRHGFNGSSYYAEMFKKEMGCAPGDYRKWYLGKGDGACPLKPASVRECVPEEEEPEQAPVPARSVGVNESMPAHLL